MPRLMPQNPTRRWPWGLIGMLGLLVAVEAGLEAHHLDFTRFYIHDWRFTGHAASTSTAGCRVLCLGDSLAKFGLDPKLIGKTLGGDAYNLAVCDGQASSSYFLLKRALAAGARPEAVVVDFAPHLLAHDARHNLRQWPEMLGPIEAVDLGLTTSHAGFFAALSLGSLLPSVKDRLEIRQCVLAALRGASASRRHEIPEYVLGWRRDRGAQLVAERPAYDGAIEPRNAAYFPRRWSCRPANERYLRRLLDLAASQGIRVVWLLPPVVPRFQARLDDLGLDASHTRFVRRFVREHGNLFVIDARHAGYGHREFIDPLHLNRRGAGRLSGEVARALASFRDGAPGPVRWATVEQPSGPLDGPAASEVAMELPHQGDRP